MQGRCQWRKRPDIAPTQPFEAADREGRIQQRKVHVATAPDATAHERKHIRSFSNLRRCALEQEAPKRPAASPCLWIEHCPVAQLDRNALTSRGPWNLNEMCQSWRRVFCLGRGCVICGWAFGCAQAGQTRLGSSSHLPGVERFQRVCVRPKLHGRRRMPFRAPHRKLARGMHLHKRRRQRWPKSPTRLPLRFGLRRHARHPQREDVVLAIHPVLRRHKLVDVLGCLAFCDIAAKLQDGRRKKSRRQCLRQVLEVEADVVGKLMELRPIQRDLAAVPPASAPGRLRWCARRRPRRVARRFRRWGLVLVVQVPGRRWHRRAAAPRLRASCEMCGCSTRYRSAKNSPCSKCSTCAAVGVGSWDGHAACAWSSPLWAEWNRPTTSGRQGPIRSPLYRDCRPSG